MSDEWRLDAVCRDMPFDTFFPTRGEALVAARAVCAQCPVAVQCLEDALATCPTEDYGVRGGKSERQRRKLRWQRRRAA